MTVTCPACGATVSVVNGIEKSHSAKCYMDLCAAYPVEDDEPGSPAPI